MLLTSDEGEIQISLKREKDTLVIELMIKFFSCSGTFHPLNLLTSHLKQDLQLTCE